MCLTIPPKLVYKFYNFKGNSNYAYSPYRGVRVRLEPDEHIKSNRQSRSLTKTEQRSRSINKGLHVFFSKEVALNAAKRRCRFTDFVIAEFDTNLKDLVAVGKFGRRDSAVYHRLKFKRFVYYSKEGSAIPVLLKKKRRR